MPGETAASAPCEPGPGNAPVADSETWCSPVVALQGAVDSARRIGHLLGARPYRVELVWTKRDTRLRAQEIRRVELIPVKVSNQTEIEWDQLPGGFGRLGLIRLSEISPNLVTEDDLYGRLDGKVDLPPDHEFFYEITLRARCEGAEAGRPQRYQVASIPWYDPLKMGWEILVTPADPNRARPGEKIDPDQTRRHPATPRPRKRIRA